MINLNANRLFALLLILLVNNPATSQRPNVIYIMTDDMGYADLSGYGRKEYQTPNLDKLAAQGIKFTNAYSAASLCTPTRVAYMTGRYSARTPVGLIEPLTGTPKDTAFGLTADYPSIATLIKASGYETALIGKWHLGFQARHHPGKNGFDYFFGFKSGGIDYISHKGGSGNRLHDLYENESPVHPKGYLTDILTEKAVSYVSKKHAAPFFLTLNYNAPHWPWQGPTDAAYHDTTNFQSGGSPAIFAAMMKSLDDGIGRLMEALDGSVNANNTIVIFTNDNGGERFSDNGGLADKKGTLWEGGIRVPAFVRWPGKIAPGRVTDQVAVTMDWTKTILSIAGAKADPAFPLDGIDLMPHCIGQKPAMERTIFWRSYQRVQQKAVRMGKWKYLQDKNGAYLFDLVSDPAEKKNLKNEYQDIFTQLQQKYAEWEKTMLTPLPL
ncbi:MAG: sulfatase-like hydrolase/transferase [Chitinophagaceae bacterium]|nr:sulfatase-like hydrolase/transferase [Chitinophagaceae bacterium]